MIGSLDHKEQVKVLEALRIVLESVQPNQSLCNISNNSINHLCFLGQAEAIQYNSHHIVDFKARKVEGR